MNAVRQGQKLGYSARDYLDMVNRYGTVDTARRLIDGRENAYGFEKLWMLNKLDLTVEAIVYDNPQFQVWFSPKTIANCVARLTRVGYI
jgi:hypothetical protein